MSTKYLFIKVHENDVWPSARSISRYKNLPGHLRWRNMYQPRQRDLELRLSHGILAYFLLSRSRVMAACSRIMRKRNASTISSRCCNVAVALVSIHALYWPFNCVTLTTFNSHLPKRQHYCRCSLVNQSDLDYRTHNLNLCNKVIPAGTQHNQHWWPSQTSELCSSPVATSGLWWA